MTQLTQSIGLVAFLVWLVTVGCGLFARSPRKKPSAKMSRIRVALLAVLVFAAIWIWLASIAPLLAWAFWIGDNPHWFFRTSPYLSALFALSFAILVGARVATNRATQPYVRIQAWGSILLLALFGTAVSSAILRRIEGTSARGAAESVLKRHADLTAEGVHLVEKQPTSDASSTDSRCKTYWIMGKDEPRGRIKVCLYRRFWWTYASSERFRPSQEELERAKKWMANRTSRDHAFLILEQIVRNYPGTASAEEAQALLESR